MKVNRRRFLTGLGGTLALPMFEAYAQKSAVAKTRFLIAGNPFGMHPEFFFPKQFGKNYQLPTTLKSLEWLKDRMTIVSHTDHGMGSGHGHEIGFLNGILPSEAGSFTEKNVSVDQIVAQNIGSKVRFPSIEAGLGDGIRMNWTPNGIEKAPFTDPQKLYDYLFLNLTSKQKTERQRLLAQNGSILDAVSDQFTGLKREISSSDHERFDQFQTSVRELEQTFADRKNWIEKDKPEFDFDEYADSEDTIKTRYHALFDMVSYAFETDLTRVASIAFPSSLKYTDIEGVTRSYHGTTHNGKMEKVTAELVAIESFQIEQLSRCLRKLDSIPEPGADGSMLDHTVVLFGSGMGYGGTHSNRNLPIIVAGGGFKHLGHFDAADASGVSMPLCNLFVTLLNRFGIQRDRFNKSTGTFSQLHV